MKKILVSLSTLCLLATACKDTNTPTPPPSDGDLKFDYALLNPDFETGPSMLFNLVLSTAELKPGDEYFPAGDYISLPFYSDLDPDGSWCTPPDGTYPYNGSLEPVAGTLGCDGYMFTIIGSDEIVEKSITGGSFTLRSTDGGLDITGRVTVSDEGGSTETVAFSFTGPATMVFDPEAQPPTTLTADHPVEGLTHGAMVPIADLYKTGLANAWMVVLETADVEIGQQNVPVGSGDCVQFILNTPIGNMETIPDGEYEIARGAVTDEGDFNLSVLLPGTATSGLAGGCIYVSLNESSVTEYAMLNRGTVTVAGDGAGGYSIAFDMLDCFDHRVTGRYSGPFDRLSLNSIPFSRKALVLPGN